MSDATHSFPYAMVPATASFKVILVAVVTNDVLHSGRCDPTLSWNIKDLRPGLRREDKTMKDEKQQEEGGGEAVGE